MRWDSVKAGYELEFENDFDGHACPHVAFTRRHRCVWKHGPLLPP
jgi:hypothetical protein